MLKKGDNKAYFPIFLEFEEFLEFAASSKIPLIPQIVDSSNSSDWGFLEDFFTMNLSGISAIPGKHEKHEIISMRSLQIRCLWGAIGECKKQ